MRDYHIHLGYGDFRRENRENRFADPALNSAYNNLLEYGGRGFTYLRDGGDRDMLAFSLKGEAKKLGIRLDSPGRAIVKAGCYGKRLGHGVETLAELKEELRFLEQAGVDLLKVILTGLVDCGGGQQRLTPYFSRRERLYIRDCSRSAGWPVMVHVNGVPGIRAALEMGATTVEHGYFIDGETLTLLKEHGTAWVPTVAPFGNAVLYDHWLPGWNQDLVRRIYEGHMEAVAAGFRRGIYILPGSDAGSSIVPHGSGAFDEWRFLQRAKEKALAAPEGEK